MLRHDRILGRSDDMIIFRAVNIYPGQVDHVLSGIEGLGSEYRMFLDRKEDGRDYMTLQVERGQEIDVGNDAELSKQIEIQLKKQIMVSPQVEVLAYGELPRSERKSRRVYDRRDSL